MSVKHVCFDLEHDKKIPDELLHSEGPLIYNIPPLQLPLIKHFFSHIAPDRKILFISSTSVYGKNSGNVDEKTELDLTIGNTQLIATEAFLQSRFKNLTILRPGGLYGDKRHPITFLQGKKDLTTGDEFTHLVHLQDCIDAILKILENEIWGDIFNLVSDLDMKKKEYYTEIALKLQLEVPRYQMLKKENPTIISNKKSKMMLGLIYKDPRDTDLFS